MTEEQRYLFGDLLRQWRTTRKVPQLELASAADVSARHLSFLETGRSVPSRAMVLRLAEHLDVHQVVLPRQLHVLEDLQLSSVPREPTLFCSPRTSRNTLFF